MIINALIKKKTLINDEPTNTLSTCGVLNPFTPVNGLRHHAKLSNVINLNWLPICERIELSLLKMTHKSLNHEGWPKHLQLEFQRSCSYNLRSSDAPQLSVPRETDTFKSMAARSFNSLPDSVRQLIDYHTFAKATRKYLFQKLKTQVV